MVNLNFAAIMSNATSSPRKTKKWKIRPTKHCENSLLLFCSTFRLGSNYHMTYATMDLYVLVRNVLTNVCHYPGQQLRKLVRYDMPGCLWYFQNIRKLSGGNLILRFRFWIRWTKIRRCWSKKYLALNANLTPLLLWRWIKIIHFHVLWLDLTVQYMKRQSNYSHGWYRDSHISAITASEADCFRKVSENPEHPLKQPLQ